jgi:hypothetical protein
MNLSQSLFTKGIQCPKSLWLHTYNKEVLTAPDNSTLKKIEMDNVIGDLACQLFPNGVEIPATTNFDDMLAQTSKQMDEGIKYIYKATFSFKGILIMIDILSIDENGISIYEVKNSLAVKDIYVHDVSIQFYVLKKLGYSVKTANVVHINSEYVRDRDLEIKELFTVSNVTNEAVKLQEDIPNILKDFEIVLADNVNEPKIDIGVHCHNADVCDAKNHCWKTQKEIPDYSIFDIFKLGSKKQRLLSKKGIKDIKDVPEKFDMTASQAIEVETYKSKETFVNKKQIKEFVDKLTYPIYHLSVATFHQEIPEWKGISPYHEIPFQYSLHIEQEDGTLEHKEYLSRDSIDPRFEFTKSLCANLPDDVTVLAYNMSFEKNVIKELAHPYYVKTDQLMKIHNNMKDLMVPFQKKHYITPCMHGSYSINDVLQSLVPKFSKTYEALDGVQNKDKFVNIFSRMSTMEGESKEKMRMSLLEHSKHDTLAMVKILDILKNTK